MLFLDHFSITMAIYALVAVVSIAWVALKEE